MYIMLVYPSIVNECYIMLVYPSIVNECTLC